MTRDWWGIAYSESHNKSNIFVPKNKNSWRKNTKLKEDLGKTTVTVRDFNIYVPIIIHRSI